MTASMHYKLKQIIRNGMEQYQSACSLHPDLIPSDKINDRLEAIVKETTSEVINLIGRSWYKK